MAFRLLFGWPSGSLPVGLLQRAHVSSEIDLSYSPFGVKCAAFLLYWVDGRAENPFSDSGGLSVCALYWGASQKDSSTHPDPPNKTKHVTDYFLLNLLITLSKGHSESRVISTLQQCKKTKLNKKTKQKTKHISRWSQQGHGLISGYFDSSMNARWTPEMLCHSESLHLERRLCRSRASDNTTL